MADSIMREKSKAFAIEIINVCKDIKSQSKESILTNQLLRSATSIGANIYEAQYAQGKKDFISKLEIALKECHESEYWIDIMYETKYIPESIYKNISNNCGSLRRMLIASLTTIKSSSDS